MTGHSQAPQSGTRPDKRDMQHHSSKDPSNIDSGSSNNNCTFSLRPESRSSRSRILNTPSISNSRNLEDHTGYDPGSRFVPPTSKAGGNRRPTPNQTSSQHGICSSNRSRRMNGADLVNGTERWTDLRQGISLRANQCSRILHPGNIPHRQ